MKTMSLFENTWKELVCGNATVALPPPADTVLVLDALVQRDATAPSPKSLPIHSETRTRSRCLEKRQKPRRTNNAAPKKFFPSIHVEKKRARAMLRKKTSQADAPGKQNASSLFRFDTPLYPQRLFYPPPLLIARPQIGKILGPEIREVATMAKTKSRGAKPTTPLPYLRLSY